MVGPYIVGLNLDGISHLDEVRQKRKTYILRERTVRAGQLKIPDQIVCPPSWNLTSFESR
jgi:hypothetical protein